MMAQKESAIVATVNNDKTVSFGTPIFRAVATGTTWVCVMIHLLIE